MALLLLLARRAPDTVTRDEIIEVIWGGRVVTDDAINKQVSKLRAALADPLTDPPLIQTIPKVGMRLTAVAEPIAEARRKARGTLLIVAASGLLVVTAVTLALAWDTPPELIEEPLTSSTGTEFDPALSIDGRWLAYASRTSGGPAAIFVRPVAIDRPQRVSPADVDASSPAWSEDGKLAFVGQGADGCAIFVRDRSGRIRRLTRCVAADFGGLAWLGPDSLVVADRPGLGKSYELHIVNLNGGRRRLVAPPTGDLGDTHPLASRDDRQVYFLRSPTVGSSELHQLSLATGAVERLSAPGERVNDLALGPGNSLILSAQRGDDRFALWKFSTSGRRWTRLAPGAAPNLAGSRDGRLFAYSRVERQTVLWRLPLRGTSAGAPLTPSTQSDWSPAVSPDGRTLAFLSNRSGSEEVWLLDLVNGGSKRLTRFDGPNIQDLAWSPDSAMLLTSVTRGSQFDIVLIDVASGRSRSVAKSDVDERHGAFTPNGNGLLFVRRSGPKFELRRYDFASAHETAVAGAVMRIVPSARSNLIVFTRPFQDGTWVLEGGKTRKISQFPDLTRIRDVAVAGETIWTVDASGKDARLVAVDVRSGRQQVVRTLPDIARPSGLAITGDSVIYARSLRLDADLVALRLKD